MASTASFRTAVTRALLENGTKAGGPRLPPGGHGCVTEARPWLLAIRLEELALSEIVGLHAALKVTGGSLRRFKAFRSSDQAQGSVFLFIG